MLLLHTGEDLLEPEIKIEHQPTVDKLRQRRFVAHALYNDRDWDSLWPVLKKYFRTGLDPWPRLIETRHFYRHTLAAWNLTAWEAVEAMALAEQTSVTVRRGRLVFELDMRPRVAPKLDAFPR